MWLNVNGNASTDPYYLNPAQYPLDYRETPTQTKVSSASVVGANCITVVLIGDSLSTNGLTQAVSPPTYTIQNPTKLFNFNLWDGGIVFAAEPLVSGPRLIPGFGYTGVRHWATVCCDALITADSARKITMAPIAYGGTFAADWADGGLYKQRIVVAGRRLDSMGLLTGTSVVVHLCIGVNDCGFDELEGSSTRTPLYATRLDSIIATIQTYMPGAKILIGKNTWGGGPLNPGAGHQLLGYATVRSAIDAKVNGTTIFAGADWDTLNDSYRHPAPDLTHWNFTTGMAAAAGLVQTAIEALV